MSGLLIVELFGLILGIIGQLLTLVEPIKLRQGLGVEVYADVIRGKPYRQRLKIHNLGIILTALGFFLQALGIIIILR